PLAGSAQVGNGGLGGGEHPGQVDSDDVVPQLAAGLLNRGGAGGDTGVGDDDIETPEFGDAPLECGVHGVFVADVDLGDDDPASEVFDHFSGFGEFVGRTEGIAELEGGVGVGDVEGDDVGAGLGKFYGVGSALSAS